MSKFASFFPSIGKGSEVYLDSAATSQRVATSIDAMQGYYQEYNANVHRGTYKSAQQSTIAYEHARETLANFIHAPSSNNVVFTSGATAAINIVANGLSLEDLKGKHLLVCESEHHANLLPWQVLAKRFNLDLQVISLDENGQFGQNALKNALANINKETALVAIGHVSNVLGNIYPVKELCKKAQLVGAISVIDGTQAPAHLRIDVQDIDCDFYALSGHKMYAGTGIGVLYGKFQWLEALSPSVLGGEMITHVSMHDHTLQKAPLKFEAGTPNIAGAIGMAAASQFIRNNLLKIAEHETSCYDHLLKGMRKFEADKKLVILGNQDNSNKQSISLLSFYSQHHHANDIASFLASQNIAVRAGQHCAMPLMQSLDIVGCVRISIACYTKLTDIDALLSALNDLFYNNEDTRVKHADNMHIDNTHTTKLENELALQIKQASNWTAKHRLLMLESRSLPVLSVAARTYDTKIEGCESSVWLMLDNDEKRGADQSKLPQFFAYSDSKVVRGLLSLIVNRVNNQISMHFSDGDLAEVPWNLSLSGSIKQNIEDYLSELGLSVFFSKGRRDGIQQVLIAIESLLSDKAVSP